jgi:hypothetical protein
MHHTLAFLLDIDAMRFGVSIYRYVTEGLFDAHMWQTLETKAKFMARIRLPAPGAGRCGWPVAR